MNRSAGLRPGASRLRGVTTAPGRRPALQSRGSWSQCMRKSKRRLSMNRKVGQASRLPPSATPTERNRSRWRARWAGGTPALRWARCGSWSQCMLKSERSLSMNRVQKREQAPALQALSRSAWPAARFVAERMECVRLAGAFHGSWTRCMITKPRRLSRTILLPSPLRLETSRAPPAKGGAAGPFAPREKVSTLRLCTPTVPPSGL